MMSKNWVEEYFKKKDCAIAKLLSKLPGLGTGIDCLDIAMDTIFHEHFEEYEIKKLNEKLKDPVIAVHFKSVIEGCRKSREKEKKGYNR